MNLQRFLKRVFAKYHNEVDDICMRVARDIKLTDERERDYILKISKLERQVEAFRERCFVLETTLLSMHQNPRQFRAPKLSTIDAEGH